MLKQSFSDTQRAVETRLALLLTNAVKGVPERLASAMTYGTLEGGKRLRPFLHLMTARLFQGDTAVALDIACSLELMHCYSLIHDDLPGMDNSPLRRGKPSVHGKFDEHTAILAGSALQNLAFDILLYLDIPEPRRLKLIQLLIQASGAGGMMGGQQLDMDAEKSAATLSVIDISHLQDLKTGALISYALESAHIAFAEKTEEQFPQNLRLYGNHIGLAYQISDDLMDLTSTADFAGKPTQADSHKITLLSHLGLEKAQALRDQLIEDACTNLEPYGPKAQLLQEFARSLLGQ